MISIETQTRACHGIWTPWARVLCAECDYADLKDTQRWKSYPQRFRTVIAMNRTAVVDQPEGNALATCDACQCPCWARSDVVLLQQVGYKASELDWEGPFGWELEQTGGMCCALVFSTEGREIVVTAMDGEFMVGEYVLLKDDEDGDRWIDPLRLWTSASLYADGELKDAAALEAMVEECARKVIEFVRSPAKP